jgi:hypothetical protein
MTRAQDLMLRICFVILVGQFIGAILVFVLGWIK